MSDFGKDISAENTPFIKSRLKKGKEDLNKLNKETNNPPQINQTPKSQTLNQTSPTLNINQSTLNAPVLNQSVLNSSNITPPLFQDIKSTANVNIQPTPSQSSFKGPSDLPAYAGILNLSLKTWIADREGKTFANLESAEKELILTLEGIKGFNKLNYENFGGKGDEGRSNKKLFILSQLFGCYEPSLVSETNLLISINNFKRLGSALKDAASSQNELKEEFKLQPPLPSEIPTISKLDFSQIKHLSELFALPQELSNCLQLFAKDKLEISIKDLNIFLTQRFKLIQEQLFRAEKNDSAVTSVLTKDLANFISLLSQKDTSPLLPLILLYYPLPLPYIRKDINFINLWKKKVKKEEKELIVASCEIYYVSKTRGRFLIKFELTNKNEFYFDVQTSKENNGVIKDLEIAISEAMFLLYDPPFLAELNCLLTDEIYKATDVEEELSIVSSGPMRLEIVLAAYAVLVMLNKLSGEVDPSGLIDIV